MSRAAALIAAAALLAGCGGGAERAHQPPAPRLPRALAQAWSKEANAVAVALAASNGCAAQQQANQLRTDVIAAINAGRVPQAFLEPLTGAVNALPARITCTPPPKPSKPDKGKGHGRGNDQGDGNG